jgi:hypothetical protein
VIQQTHKRLHVSLSLHAAEVDFTESYIITPGMYLYVLLLLSLGHIIQPAELHLLVSWWWLKE